MKKFFSVVLCLAMLVSVFPAAIAEEVLIDNGELRIENGQVIEEHVEEDPLIDNGECIIENEEEETDHSELSIINSALAADDPPLSAEAETEAPEPVNPADEEQDAAPEELQTEDVLPEETEIKEFDVYAANNDGPVASVNGKEFSDFSAAVEEYMLYAEDESVYIVLLRDAEYFLNPGETLRINMNGFEFFCSVPEDCMLFYSFSSDINLRHYECRSVSRVFSLSELQAALESSEVFVIEAYGEICLGPDDELYVPSGFEIIFSRPLVNNGWIWVESNTQMSFSDEAYYGGDGAFIIDGDPYSVGHYGIDNSLIELYSEQHTVAGIADFYNSYLGYGFSYLDCETDADFSDSAASLDIPTGCCLLLENNYTTLGDDFTLTVRPGAFLFLPDDSTLVNNGIVNNAGAVLVKNDSGEATIINNGRFRNADGRIGEGISFEGEKEESVLTVSEPSNITPYSADFTISMDANEYLTANGYRLGISVSQSNETVDGLLAEYYDWFYGTVYYDDHVDISFHLPILNPDRTYYYQAIAMNEEFNAVVAFSEVSRTPFTTGKAEPTALVMDVPSAPLQYSADAWSLFSLVNDSGSADMICFEVDGDSQMMVFDEDGNYIWYQGSESYNCVAVPTAAGQKLLISVLPWDEGLTITARSAADSDSIEWLSFDSFTPAVGGRLYKFEVPQNNSCYQFRLLSEYEERFYDYSGGYIKVFNPDTADYEINDTIMNKPEGSVIYVLPSAQYNPNLYIGVFTPVAGDINGDGFISVYDSYLARRAAAGIWKPKAFQTAAADVYQDGSINSLDVNAIRRYVAGYITLLPVNP